MRVAVLVCFFIFCLSRISYSQDTLNHSVAYRFSLARTDFFSGLEYTKRDWLIKPSFSFELGVNRTFFQQRIFPKLGIGASYDLFNRSSFIFLGPQVYVYHSMLKVNRETPHMHNWMEYLGGSRLEIGNKWRFINVIQVGFITERYFDQLVSDYRSVSVFGYNFTLGVQYAW